MKYRAEIDGLRAVAVVPVILFHAGIDAFTGGFVGVDVFFVISGYLISTIIFNELEAGRFSIAKFYERRARRILPALTVVVLACIPFAWAWMLPQELVAFGKSVIATALFGSNVLFWIESGYFEAAADLKPLLHTWSLAVEEQYYLLFPVVIALVWRWRKTALLPLLAFAVIVSLSLAEWGSRNAPNANFFLLPTRSWELLAGVIVALRFDDKEFRSEILGWAGLGMIIAAVFCFDSDARMPNQWTILPVLGTCFVLATGRSGTKVAQLLSHKSLVGIGLVSYSAYLWHQPLLAFARIRGVSNLNPIMVTGILIATGVLAWLTWRYVEQPFRRGKPLLRARRELGFASLVCMVTLTVVGAVLIAGNGFDQRKAPSGESFSEAARLEQLLVGNFGLHRDCDIGRFTLSKNCRTSETPAMALWGDSFAMHLAGALMSSESSIPLVQLTLSQCAPIPDMALEGSITSWKTCVDFNNKVLNYILTEPSIEIVVISSPFDQLKSALYLQDGRVVTDVSERKAAIVERLQKLVQQLNSVGKRLVVVSPPPRIGLDLGLCYVRGRLMGKKDNACEFAPTEARVYGAPSVELVSAIAKVAPVIWLERFTCSSTTCQVSLDGEPLYRDHGHLSISGTKKLGERFDFAGVVKSESVARR